MKTIVLITNSFPFYSTTEEAFILPELSPLSDRFERVLLAPCTGSGEISRNLPEGIDVYPYLSQVISVKDKINGFFSPATWQHLFADARQIKNLTDILNDVAFSAYVHIYRQRICKMICDLDLVLEDTLFYTFWFNFATTALSLIPGARIVTRCHGYDIYSDRYFISDSWRRRTLAEIMKCYPASAHGADFLKNRFPDFSNKISTQLLGSKFPAGINPINTDNTIKILGCARLSETKGVIPQLRSLIQVAKIQSERNFHYTHIGDGPLMNEMRRIAAEAPDNLKISLIGEIPNDEVHHIMLTSRFDIFLLMSYSEGGMPIALSEALSYGIPAIANNVGGISSHFNSGGIKLPPDANPIQLNNAISEILDHSESYRKDARTYWIQNLSSQSLREDFAYELSHLSGLK